MTTSFGQKTTTTLVLLTEHQLLNIKWTKMTYHNSVCTVVLSENLNSVKEKLEQRHFLFPSESIFFVDWEAKETFFLFSPGKGFALPSGWNSSRRQPKSMMKWVN